MLKLYYAPHTCALASHIALEEAGAEYEAVRLSFKTGDQKKPDYLKINPKARVPVARHRPRHHHRDAGASWCTSRRLFLPRSSRRSTTPIALARVQAFNSYLCSTVHVAHAHRMRGARWADEPEAHLAMQRKVPQTSANVLR